MSNTINTFLDFRTYLADKQRARKIAKDKKKSPMAQWINSRAYMGEVLAQVW